MNLQVDPKPYRTPAGTLNPRPYTTPKGTLNPRQKELLRKVQQHGVLAELAAATTDRAAGPRNRGIKGSF